MAFLTFLYLILAPFTQPNNGQPKPRLGVTDPASPEKIYIVQSKPFILNGTLVQYRYKVKEDEFLSDIPKNVRMLDKRLIDIKRKVTLCKFHLAFIDENYPIVNLDDLKDAPYKYDRFDDVNFDGYKDIREECHECSGAHNTYEDVYLFHAGTRRFSRWKTVMGVNLQLYEDSKTLKCVFVGGDGDLEQQEIKFGAHGLQLYRKEVSSTLYNKKKQTYKIVYEKYAGRKLIAHKTRIIHYEGKGELWAAMSSVSGIE